MKRFLPIILAILLPLAAGAQYKVTSVDKQDSQYFNILWIQELEDATLVYASYDNSDLEKNKRFYLSRKAAAYVGDEPYKLMSSVNLPIRDEAEPQNVLVTKDLPKFNFVMVFEKFHPVDGFDIVEDETKHMEGYRNYYGVHFEEVEPAAFVNTVRFLDKYPVTIEGRYAKEGSNFSYMIHDKVCVTCKAEWHDKDLIYYVDIVNDSDHGVKFDWDKVWVSTTTKKKDGTVEEGSVKKYSPSSYESFLRDEDYNRARYEVGSAAGDVSRLLRHESYYTGSEWGKVGLKTLSSIFEKAEENSIQEYMKTHPVDRPSAMKSQSIKAGEAYHGFIASKSKNHVNFYTLHMVIDEHDFFFEWN